MCLKIKYLLIVYVLMLTGCATAPTQVNNLCSIFEEKGGWHEDAQDASEKWGTSIPVMMAIMHQESKFQADIQPPMQWFLFIPLGRASNAYGFAQALEGTWKTYMIDTGNWTADRDDFGDAIDFIGWYNALSYRKNGIKRDDTYHLYLAYHEGHGGFERRSFKDKLWLKKVAKKVSAQSYRYQKQYAGCKDSLDDGWFF